LNPFTGERKILAPDFPDIHTFDMFDWADWSRTMYDPTLTRVVYLTEYDDFSFVLWDLDNGREITRLPARIPMWRYIPIPRWTPDGARFVVEAWIPAENRLELFQVSRDGDIEQLTNLYPYGSATLTGLSWSPDGRYLAGWLDTSLGEKPELELIVLDTHTKQITNYCLQVRYFGEGFSGTPKEPIWSPDGTQLMVMDVLDQDHRQAILVDLVQGFAVPIAEDMEPMGWLVAP
jgi:Tol biopolymer transport system component